MSYSCNDISFLFRVQLRIYSVYLVSERHGRIRDTDLLVPSVCPLLINKIMTEQCYTRIIYFLNLIFVPAQSMTMHLRRKTQACMTVLTFRRTPVYYVTVQRATCGLSFYSVKVVLP